MFCKLFYHHYFVLFIFQNNVEPGQQVMEIMIPSGKVGLIIGMLIDYVYITLKTVWYVASCFCE